MFLFAWSRLNLVWAAIILAVCLFSIGAFFLWIEASDDDAWLDNEL